MFKPVVLVFEVSLRNPYIGTSKFAARFFVGWENGVRGKTTYSIYSTDCSSFDSGKSFNFRHYCSSSASDL